MMEHVVSSASLPINLDVTTSSFIIHDIIT
jgi:hypothetical protein